MRSGCRGASISHNDLLKGCNTAAKSKAGPGVQSGWCGRLAQQRQEILAARLKCKRSGGSHSPSDRACWKQREICHCWVSFLVLVACIERAPLSGMHGMQSLLPLAEVMDYDQQISIRFSNNGLQSLVSWINQSSFLHRYSFGGCVAASAFASSNKFPSCLVLSSSHPQLVLACSTFNIKTALSTCHYCHVYFAWRRGDLA